LEEALDKLKYGMKIIIREGSAAKNYEALHSLIKTHPDMIMFCSDDKHPNDLVEGHIDQLVKRSIGKYGHNTMDVLRAACFNPVKHYNLDVGLLKKGDPADFIVINDLEEFKVLKTYVKGRLVAEDGRSLIPSVKNEVINNFNVGKKTVDAFALPAKGDTIRIIKALDGELITESFIAKVKIKGNLAVSDPERDILKMAIINRYEEAPPAIAFIQGFGLRSGALASCIAHDSHNIIAVGVTDQEICGAVNALIANKGGISVVENEHLEVLPLPVAGIMSPDDGFAVARAYSRMDQKAKKLGTKLHSPFMTLSFMALLVIPSLKLSDKGLFDGTKFSFTSLFVE
jgi:adenine deaminase